MFESFKTITRGGKTLPILKIEEPILFSILRARFFLDRSPPLLFVVAVAVSPENREVFSWRCSTLYVRDYG